MTPDDSPRPAAGGPAEPVVPAPTATAHPRPEPVPVAATPPVATAVAAPGVTPPGSDVEEPRDRSRVIGDAIAWTARWSGRWVLIALGAVLLGLLVYELWSILLPLIMALLIASVLSAPARFLEQRLRLPAAAAAGITVLGSVLAVIGIGFALAPAVAGQSGDIVDSAVGGLQKLQDWVQASDFLTRDQVDEALQALQDRVASSGGQIASGVLVGLSAATSAVVTIVVSLILTFLFLKDGRKFQPMVRRWTGERVGPHLVEVLGRSWKTLGGYIRTQALVSLIDAVIIGAGLLVVGVPLAIPLAVLTFAGGFIPIVGAFVAGALAVLVALVSNGTTEAIIVFLIVLAVQQLEGNVLSPWLQSKSMQLHAAVVLLGVTLGSTLFGIVGAFLAVPVCAVAAVVMRYLDELTENAAMPALAPADPRPAADPQPGEALGTGS